MMNHQLHLSDCINQMDHSHRKVYETLLKQWANHCYEYNGDSQHLNRIDHWCQILSDEEDLTQVQNLMTKAEFIQELQKAELHNKNPVVQTKRS